MFFFLLQTLNLSLNNFTCVIFIPKKGIYIRDEQMTSLHESTHEYLPRVKRLDSDSCEYLTHESFDSRINDSRVPLTSPSHVYSSSI